MDYEIIIGLEVHAQLLTKSKMYCSCSADYANAPPNTHVCPICLGTPGVLPTINQMAHKAPGCQSDFRLSGKLYERPQFF